MDKSTKRYLSQRQRVAHFRSYTLAGLNFLTYLQSLRSTNIAFFTISINHKSNTATAVRVIFYRFNGSRNIILFAFEINKTIQTLVTTADVAHGHLTLVVAAT